MSDFGPEIADFMFEGVYFDEAPLFDPPQEAARVLSRRLSRSHQTLAIEIDPAGLAEEA